MKVPRRGSSSSPSSLMLLANGNGSKPESSPVNGKVKYYQFELEPHHIVQGGKGGQKLLYACDICNNLFRQMFSLKRHYLRFHINFYFVSPRDLNNCAIAVASQLLRSGAAVAPCSNDDRSSERGRPLLYRCHICGHLTTCKEYLLKHQEGHSATSTADSADGISIEQAANRCPRCSTAFSLRKTLLRHLKKNRCRGGGKDIDEDSSRTSFPDSASMMQDEQVVGSQSESSDSFDGQNGDEQSAENECEVTPSGCPRFVCTMCAKVYNSYVSVCQHRRLAHDRIGICLSEWLRSRKPMGSRSRAPLSFSRRSYSREKPDYVSFIRIAHENLQGFIDGKRIHIRVTSPPVDDEESEAPCEELPTDRWSWAKDQCDVEEVFQMDVPLQQALFRGLQSTILEDADKTESSQSPDQGETMALLAALQLQRADPSPSIPDSESPAAFQRPELSGEWTRIKSYICLPCGQMFQDFLSMLDHQHSSHSSVLCTHIVLDDSMKADSVASELTRQIVRSGCCPPASPEVLRCSKCHYDAQSLADLHSHILLCSNHVSSSPYRKARRGRLSTMMTSGPSRKWRGPGGKSGRSKGMQRRYSNQHKSCQRSLRSRSPKENKTSRSEENVKSGVQRKSVTGALATVMPSQKTQKKGKGKGKKQEVITTNQTTGRILRQRLDSPQVNGGSSKPANRVENSKPKSKKKVAKKALNRSTTGKSERLHNCDACDKQFVLRSSLLKHKHYCPAVEVVDEADETRSSSDSPASDEAKSKTKLNSSPSRFKLTRSAKDKDKPEDIEDSPLKELPSADNSPPRKKVGRPRKHQSISNLNTTTSPQPNKSQAANNRFDGETSNRNVTPTSSSTTPKRASKDRDTSPSSEEEPLPMSSSRPVRSSRKATSFIMEDEMEARFKEALSPAQIVKVSEKTCPFCEKKYTYKSYFNKHLLEGCNSAAVSSPTRMEDEQDLLTPSPVPKKRAGTPIRASKSTITAKEDDINMHNTPLKKQKMRETTESADSNLERRTKPSGKTTDKTPTKSDARVNKGNKTKKDIVPNGLADTKSGRLLKNPKKKGKANVSKKMLVDQKRASQKGAAPKKRKLRDRENKKQETKKRKTTKETDAELTSAPVKNGKSSAPQKKLERPNHQAKQKLVKPKIADNPITVEESNAAITSLSSEAIIPESRSDDAHTETTENGFSQERIEEGEESMTSEEKALPLCERGASNCKTSADVISGEPNRQEPTPGDQSSVETDHGNSTELDNVQVTAQSPNQHLENGTSHEREARSRSRLPVIGGPFSLDPFSLGQVLEKSMKTGILRSYSTVTLYPVRIRQLERLASAYRQLARKDSDNFSGSKTG